MQPLAPRHQKRAEEEVRLVSEQIRQSESGRGDKARVQLVAQNDPSEIAGLTKLPYRGWIWLAAVLLGFAIVMAMVAIIRALFVAHI